jgi:hypothetical protein
MRAEPVHEKARRIKRAVPQSRLVGARPLVALRQSTLSLAPSRLLALQRTSGNRAVDTLVRRQATETTKADARTSAAVRATIIMDDPIGVIPLLAFSQEGNSVVHVDVPSTALDSDLMRYMVQGIKIKQVKISTPSVNLELDDVYIASFSRSASNDEAIVHMTLNFASQHVK